MGLFGKRKDVVEIVVSPRVEPTAQVNEGDKATPPNGLSQKAIPSVSGKGSDASEPLIIENKPARPSVAAHEELARIRKEMPEIFERAAKKVLTGELELIGWGLSLPRVQKLDQSTGEKPWFFVGDIHGDFLAWHCLLERIRKEKDFRMCFLGDLIDRGPLHIECFAALLDAVEKYPGRILWITGNHDAAVKWNQKERKFSAGGIQPAEFTEWLSGSVPEHPVEQFQAWGRLFADVVERLPRAVLFPDGLLATHGGVPLNDRIEFLKTMEAFHHERCLEDFTWTRLVNYPRKVGWKTERRQNSSDFGVGYKDLEDFCKAVEPVLPVRCVVRAHDHVAAGFEIHAGYKEVPALTLNGFGFNYLNGSVHAYRKSLVVGIGRPGQLPEIEEVTFTPEEHAGVYPVVNQQVGTATAEQEHPTPPVGCASSKESPVDQGGSK